MTEIEQPSVRSIVPGFVWPGIPDAMDAALLSLHYQFGQTQWWPEEQLLTHQFTQLHDLLKHAIETVPFYRDRLRACELNLHAPLDAAIWRTIPLLRHDEVRGCGREIISTQVPPAHGGTNTVLTRPDSNGQPLSLVTTAMTDLFKRTLMLREHQWHGREFDALLATIRALPEGELADPPNGVESVEWDPSTHFMETSGRSALLDIRCSPDDQIAWLRRIDPHYLVTYPSNLAALIGYISAAQTAPGLSNLRHVQTTNEVLHSSLRADCQAALGVPLIDAYGTPEIGPIATQCPDHSHYHIHSETVYVEILDDIGAPCLQGESGRLVVTSLNNYAMPLIRYELDDNAEVGERCPCGRGLPVLKWISGPCR